MPKNKTKRVVVKDGISAHDVSLLCAQADPFCKHAYGAKIPDGNAGHTIAFHHRFVGTMQPQNTGVQYWMFHPSYGTGPAKLEATDSVSNVNPDMPAVSSLSINAGSFPSFVSKARVVSAGVRFTAAQPSDLPRGYLELVEIEDFDNLVDTTVHDSAQFDLNPIASTLSGGKSITYIFDTRDSDWDDETTSPSPGLVAVAHNGSPSGGDASGSFHVEYIIHYEGVIDMSAALTNSMASPPLVRNSIIMDWRQRANYAGAYLTGDPSFSIEKKAREYGTKALRWAGGKAASIVGGYFGGPIGYQAAGMLQDRILNVD